MLLVCHEDNVWEVEFDVTGTGVPKGREGGTLWKRENTIGEYRTI